MPPVIAIITLAIDSSRASHKPSAQSQELRYPLHGRFEQGVQSYMYEGRFDSLKISLSPEPEPPQDTTQMIGAIRTKTI